MSQDGACRSGNRTACDDLAEHYSHRELPAPNDEAGKRAGEALRDACEQRALGVACLAYAQMRKSGVATGTPDGEGAKPYFAKLKAAGDLNGWRGEPTSADGTHALDVTRLECEKGRARACGQLGWAAYNGVQRDKSVKDAFTAYARACNLGSGNGCRWAGHFAATYPSDTGAADKADELLRRGCEQHGNGGACDELGIQLAKRGDEAAALPRWEKGCEGGIRGACMRAGQVLAARSGADAARGAAMLKTACDAGETAACKK
jgi:TPR repeat protein